MRVLCTPELYHHGILGMKWGVRRYQNEDGSLTPAGKRRLGLGVDSGQVLRTAGNVAAIGGSIAGVAAATKAITSAEDDAFKPGKDGKPSQAEKTAKAAESIVDSSKKLSETTYNATRTREDLSAFTDDELKAIIARRELERKYSQLSAGEVTSGQEKVQNTLQIIGTVAAIGVSAATIYSMVKNTKANDAKKASDATKDVSELVKKAVQEAMGAKNSSEVKSAETVAQKAVDMAKKTAGEVVKEAVGAPAKPSATSAGKDIISSVTSSSTVRDVLKYAEGASSKYDSRPPQLRAGASMAEIVSYASKIGSSSTSSSSSKGQAITSAAYGLSVSEIGKRYAFMGGRANSKQLSNFVSNPRSFGLKFK